MNFQLNAYPFIRFSLSFITGILFSHLVPISSDFLFLAFIILLIILFIVLVTNVIKYKNNFLLLVLCLISFTLGNYLYTIQVQSKSSLNQEITSIENLVVIGRIESIDLRQQDEISFTIQTDSLRIDNIYRSKKVKLICKLRVNESSVNRFYDRVLPGYKVRIEGTLQRGRDARNPGEFNYDQYLQAIGVSGLFLIKDEYDIKIIEWNPHFFKTALFKTRLYIDSKINSLHGPNASGLLRGLLLADRSKIDYETKTEFINSGVIHILAVSGLHVGYIIVIFLVVLGRFNIYIKSFLTIIGLLLFLLITGMPASVFRAVTMAVIISIAYIVNRSSNIYNSLTIAAFIILAINPGDLFSPGFQLSFIAVLSIAVIYPIVQRFIFLLDVRSKILRYILLFMGVSLSAQIGTLPLTLLYFGKISLIALVTNLIVIPLAGFIVGISIVTLFFSTFFNQLAILYASVNDFLTNMLFGIISIAGNLKWSHIPIRNFSIYDSVIFYTAIIFIITVLSKFKSLSSKLTASIFIILNAFIFGSLDNKDLLENDKLSVMIIDVNRGDAALIKFPNGKTALINGGYSSFYFDNGERVIKPLLRYLDIERIDYAVISSMNQENLGGFISLIKSGIIKNVIKPVIDSNFIVDIEFEKLLRENKINISNYYQTVKKIGNTHIYFLNDSSIELNQRINKSQNIVFKLQYGQTSFLFPGNIEHEAEYYYCGRYKNFLRSNVLKISNNGSINSTSLEFVQNVKPNISLISVEYKNKFSNISPIILERLRKNNSTIYRTDEEGAVLLQSDGLRIKKVNWK